MNLRSARFLQLVGVFSAIIATSRVGAQTIWTSTMAGAGDYFWGSSGNWSSGVPTSSSDAQFNSANYTNVSPTLAGAYTAASITVNAGAENLFFNENSGGALTLTSAFNQNAGAGSLYAVTIATPLSLGSGFNFTTTTANAVLELAGTTTSAGVVNVKNGIELLLGGDMSGVQSFNVSTGADLKFIRTDTFAMNIVNNSSVTFSDGGGYTSNYTGHLSGTGTVTVNDPTIFTASNGNTYSGITYLNNSLQDDANANAYSPNSAMVLNAAGIVQMTANETIAGYTDVSGSKIQIDSATLTINGPGALYGSVAADGGLITLNPGPGNTFSLFGTNGFGSATVTLTSGKLELQASSDASGSNITVSGGTLVFDANAAQPTVYTVVNNHEVDVNAPTLDAAISGTGNVYLNAVGPGNVVAVNGTQTYTGQTYVAASVTAQNGSANVFASGSRVNLGANSVFDIEYSDSVGNFSGPSSSSVTLANGTILTLTSGTSSGIFAGIISGAGGLDFLSGTNSTFSGANTYTGGTTIEGSLAAYNSSGSATGYYSNSANAPSVTINSGGFLFVGANDASGSVDGTIAIMSGGQFHYSRSDNTTLVNKLTGAGNVYFQGSGTTTITALNDYSGTTQQTSNGQLILSNASLGTGGMLNYGILSGAGSVSTGNYLTNYGASKVSPVLNGTPSTISTGSAYFYQNSVFEVSMNSATGTAGTNWSLLAASGSLDFTPIPNGQTMTIKITSLNGGISNFNPYQSYTWDIMTNNGTTYGFYPSAFTIDTSSFMNSTLGGAFSIGLDGTAIALDFTPVPEPSTWALMLAGAGVVGFSVWRMRRRQAA